MQKKKLSIHEKRSGSDAEKGKLDKWKRKNNNKIQNSKLLHFPSSMKLFRMSMFVNFYVFVGHHLHKFNWTKCVFKTPQNCNVFQYEFKSLLLYSFLCLSHDFPVIFSFFFLHYYKVKYLIKSKFKRFQLQIPFYLICHYTCILKMKY